MNRGKPGSLFCPKPDPSRPKAVQDNAILGLTDKLIAES